MLFQARQQVTTAILLLMGGCISSYPMEATNFFVASVTLGDETSTSAAAGEVILSYYQPGEDQTCLESWRFYLYNGQDTYISLTLSGPPGEGSVGEPQPGPDAEDPNVQVLYRNDAGDFSIVYGGTVQAVSLDETLAVFMLSDTTICRVPGLIPSPQVEDITDCTDGEDVEVEIVPEDEYSELMPNPEATSGTGPDGGLCLHGYDPEE